MNGKAWLSIAALFAVTAPLYGCNPYPLPGPLVFGKCGRDAHTEAYPLAREDRRAYGCKANQEGYLESAGQADQRRN